MITDQMTIAADAAASRYESTLTGFRMIFADFLNSSKFGSQKHLREQISQAYYVGRSYLDDEIDRIREETDRFAHVALDVTLEQLKRERSDTLPDALSEHLNDSDSYLERELSIQIERDIATLSNAMRRTMLGVSMAARAHRIPSQAALIQYRISNPPEISFYFRDQANRQWPSKRFVRSLWRQHLLGIYNETVLMTLADHGIDRARVVHPDKNDVPEVSIAPNSALPTYTDVRNHLFHPNSNAILSY